MNTLNKLIIIIVLILSIFSCIKTNVNKQCSGDLDTVATEFSANPKHINNGCNISIDRHWFGHYTLSIDYGKLDEFSTMSIFYDIVINQDSCIFSGMGYKTYFTDLCGIHENKDELYLIYLNNIDGDGFTNHSDMDTIATLIKSEQQYYIKSSIIADKNWEYNKIILLNKIRK